MRPELLLIKALLNKDLYNDYRSSISIPKDERELTFLYTNLDDIHNSLDRDISYSDYVVWSLRNTNNPELASLLHTLEKYEVGHDLILKLLVEAKEKALANKIALKAIEVTEGKGSLDELNELLNTVETTNQDIDDDKELFVTDNLEDLYKNHVQKVGLRWRLQSLNRMLGSLRKGNFGFIFARPETGKTTFLASEITFMASQLTEDQGPILWFNNEEDGKQVQIRIFQAALGLEAFELYLDIQKNNELYQSIINGKLRIIDSANTSKTDIERYCKRFNPSLVLVDQLDKVKGFDGDREDLKLGYIYQWARELAKTYCPVIGVSQADGSGEGVKWLTMAHVANAKTAKQAEADWILGIGKSNQDGFEFIRHLHASKNKLPGDEDTDPKLRHGKMDVIIEPNIARYKDYE